MSSLRLQIDISPPAHYIVLSLVNNPQRMNYDFWTTDVYLKIEFMIPSDKIPNIDDLTFFYSYTLTLRILMKLHLMQIITQI